MRNVKEKLVKKSERVGRLSPQERGTLLAYKMIAVSEKLMKQIDDNFFSESPLLRYWKRAGAGRKRMRKYRLLKRIRRSQSFRQDRW